jgi:prepilin-type processing-associated H-X9-DG protein
MRTQSDGLVLQTLLSRMMDHRPKGTTSPRSDRRGERSNPVVSPRAKSDVEPLRVWRYFGVPFAGTDYAGVQGPHNLGNASIFGGLPDCHNDAAYGYLQCSGSFRRHSILRPVTLQSITDGTSNTIIEWAIGNGTWASLSPTLNYKPPQNLAFDNWPNQIGFRSRHPGGANFLAGDGSVKFLKDTIARAIYRGLGTRAGGEVISSDSY